MKMSVDAYIANQRALLDRLEQFVRTPEYERLLSGLQGFVSDDPEPWLADWLVSPAFGLGGAIPIEVAAAPDGVDLLVEQLLRIAHSTGA